MWNFWFRSAIVLGICCGGACVSAQAKNFKYSANINSHFWTGGLSQNIALTGKGDKSLPFQIPSNGLVAIAFSAECQLIGGRQSFINIDIVVDGAVIPITGGDDAFCAGRGVGVEGGWAMYSVTAAKVLTAGTHTLRVRAAAIGIHTGARLDDIAVLIYR